jgi:hypothetical protein
VDVVAYLSSDEVHDGQSLPEGARRVAGAR